MTSRIDISRLTYGTMQWGDGASTADAEAMFDACLAQGITHFDTAWVYTGGASETILGNLTQSNRADIQIATKVGYTGGASALNILKQLDQSRSRLRSDYVDVLYMHRFDDQTSLEETFTALARLQSEQIVRHIGVSNYAAWQVMKAQGVAAKLGTKIDVIQPMYSLVKRQAEVELIPMAKDQDIAVVPYSPLGGGLLTGKYTNNGTGRLTTDHRYKARYGLDWMHAAAAALTDLAGVWGHHSATLAVAWAAHAGCHPIISAKSNQQLEPSLKALTLKLSDEQRDAITALSPAPPPATDRIEEA